MESEAERHMTKLFLKKKIIKRKEEIYFQEKEGRKEGREGKREEG